MEKLTRRDLLRLLGLGGAVLVGGGLVKWLSSKEGTPTVSPTTSPSGSTPVPTVSQTAGGTATAPGGTPDVEIALRAVPGEAQILPGAPTQVWRYEGQVLNGPPEALRVLPDTYLGPIFQLEKGQKVRVHFTNQIPEVSIVHWHGLHVPDVADGHPRFVIDTGETYVYDFTVMDRAGTYWYHPHPHGRTGPQAYHGLAGLLLIRDEEEQALGLPSGEYDVPLVIQDRRFDSENQLVYIGGRMDQMMGFLGDRILVNGKPDFTLPIATRPYRLRLLNGSNSRIYKLAWEDGTPMTVIGTTGGLLEKPVQREYVTLAPSQRLELWIDFRGRAVGSQLRLLSLPSAAPGSTRPLTVLTVQIEREEKADVALPPRLTTIPRHNPADAVNAGDPRTFTLAMSMGRGWTINGRTFEMTAVARDEVVKLGDLEVWQFVNQAGGGMGMGGGMALPHPMHVHGLQFQVLEREVAPASRAAWETLSGGYVDEGWWDTVLVMPGERVKIALRFEDFESLYLYHCHNLEHEDMGMMRNYRVVA